MKILLLMLLSLSVQAKDFTFVGVHVGSSQVNSDINSEENNSEGKMFGLSVGKEYKFSKWNFNLSLDYNNHKIETDLNTSTYSKVELESNYLNVSFNPTVSLGNVDLGFKLDIPLSNDGILVTQEDSAKSLVGVNAYYNIKTGDNKVRVGAFAQKDTQEDYTQVGLSFQYAFGKSKKVSKKKKQYVTSVTFKDDVVRFENDSAKLSLRSKAFLAELGTYLNEHSYNWKHLEIIGHTSTEGKLDYNKYLSYKRTNSVFAILKEMGISSRKVTLEGKGEIDPLVVEKTALDKRMNRRVELRFIGMKKGEDLKKFIKILKKKHQ